jgi:hypothetical protein
MAKKVAQPELFSNRLKITAKPAAGFWRAGVFHPAQAVTHAGGTFTVDQAQMLEDESMLVVEDLGPEPAEA